MAFETTISVKTRDLGRLVNVLTRAGAIVLDRGERTTTDDGVAAEASVAVCFVDERDLDVAAFHGVRA